MVARIEVRDSFRLTGRGELVIYREVEGNLTAGTEVISELHGDRWRVTSFGPTFGPPRYDGSSPLEQPQHFLLRPIGEPRRIQPGEIFRVISAPEGGESSERAALADQEDHEAVAEAKRRNAELTSGAVAGRTHQQVMAAARQVLRCE